MEKFHKQLEDSRKIFHWLIDGHGIHGWPIGAIKHITKEFLIKNYNVEHSYFGDCAPIITSRFKR